MLKCWNVEMLKFWKNKKFQLNFTVNGKLIEMREKVWKNKYCTDVIFHIGINEI